MFKRAFRIVAVLAFIYSPWVAAAPVSLTSANTNAVFSAPYTFSGTQQITGGNISVSLSDASKTVGKVEYTFGASQWQPSASGSGFTSNSTMTVTGPDTSGDGIIDDKDGNGKADISQVKLKGNGGPSISATLPGLIVSTPILPAAGAQMKVIINGTNGVFQSSVNINKSNQSWAVSGNVDASTPSTFPDGQNPNFPNRPDIANLSELGNGDLNGNISFANSIGFGTLRLTFQVYDAGGTLKESRTHVGASVGPSSGSNSNPSASIPIDVPFTLLNEDIVSNALTPYLDDLRSTFRIDDFGLTEPITIPVIATSVYSFGGVAGTFPGVHNWPIPFDIAYAYGSLNVSFNGNLTIWPTSMVATTPIFSDALAVPVPEVSALALLTMGLTLCIPFVIRPKQSR